MYNNPLFKKLFKIKPSRDNILKYYSCQVKLKNGKQVDRVIFIEEDIYLKEWGHYSQEKLNNYFIAFDLILDIKESPYRLPVKLANKMYNSGESGMGYCVFTLVMRNGSRLPFVTGNIVDFPNLPPGYDYSDIVDLFPHIGRELLQDERHHWIKKPYTDSADFKRCIFKSKTNKRGQAGSLRFI